MHCVYVYSVCMYYRCVVCIYALCVCMCSVCMCYRCVKHIYALCVGVCSVCMCYRYVVCAYALCVFVCPHVSTYTRMCRNGRVLREVRKNNQLLFLDSEITF